MRASGMDRSRVAEVLVTLGPETGVHGAWPRRRGSGYQVSSTVVLTAWHVVAGMSRVVARLDAGTARQRSMEAVACQRIGNSDLAVLTVAVPPGEPALRACSLGRIPEVATILDVQLAGFPRWKLRSRDRDVRYRNLCHLSGTVPTLANSRDNTLEIIVEPPAADLAASPWEGMSGGPVWIAGAIVAVLTEHHPREGLGRLSALRLDRILARLDAEQRARHLPLLGLASLTDLVEPDASEASTGRAAGGVQVNIAGSGATQFSVQHGTLNIAAGRDDLT